MKKLALVITLMAALLASGCTKSSSEAAIKKSLIGTWEGVYKTTMNVNGEEIVLTSANVTLLFTEDKLTQTVDDVSAVFDYSVGKDESGTYFTATRFGLELGTVNFSISGKTMTILGGNSGYAKSFPETLTKK